MSTKNGKKARRRATMNSDDEPAAAFRPPIADDLKAAATRKSESPQTPEKNVNNGKAASTDGGSNSSTPTKHPTTPTKAASTNGSQPSTPDAAESRQGRMRSSTPLSKAAVKMTPPVTTNGACETIEVASAAAVEASATVDLVGGDTAGGGVENGENGNSVVNGSPGPESRDNGSGTGTPDAELLLVADNEEPELQFEDQSDIDSRKSSPILLVNRCTTRRSQIRSLSTPKTPLPNATETVATSETNTTLTDPEQDVVAASVAAPSLTPISVANETISSCSPFNQPAASSECDTADPDQSFKTCTDDNDEPKEVVCDKESAPVAGDEEEEEDIADLQDVADAESSIESNVSTHAVAGSDMTRQMMEFSLLDEPMRFGGDVEATDGGGSNQNSYLFDSNVTLVQQMRRMTGRRSIRPMASSSSADFRRNLFERKYGIEPASVVGGFKRKYDSDSDLLYGQQQTAKRARADEGSAVGARGWFSYITHPFHSLRQRFRSSTSAVTTARCDGKSELPEMMSGPTLTGYRRSEMEVRVKRQSVEADGGEQDECHAVENEDADEDVSVVEQAEEAIAEQQVEAPAVVVDNAGAPSRKSCVVM